MLPSVESIEEFKVSSANNNDEFMQVTDITTTSKSGSNQFHGIGFWFVNDSALSSVNRFAPRDASGTAIKPDIQTNTFGASASRSAHLGPSPSMPAPIARSSPIRCCA